MAVRKNASRTAWSVAEAKLRLDEVIDEVEGVGPQTLVKYRNEQAVVVPVDDWGTRQRRKGTLVKFLDNSPLMGLDIDFERHPDAQERDIDLCTVDRRQASGGS